MNNNLIKAFKEIPKTFLLIIISSIIILIACWCFFLKQMLSDVETISYDWRAKIASEKNAFGVPFSHHDPNIVLLAAGDDTTKILENYPEIGLGRWPWKREVWGNVVNFISKGNPKSIVFDLKFEGSQGETIADKESDKYFADAVKNKNVVISTALSHPRKNSAQVDEYIKIIDEELKKQNKSIENVPVDFVNKTIASFYSQVYNKSSLSEKFALKPQYDYYQDVLYGNENDRKIPDSITFYQKSSIYDELLANTQYLGVINLQQSENVVFRNHVPLYKLVYSDGSSYIPSLPLSAALSAIPEKEKTPFRFEKNKIIIGQREIPLNNEGNILLNWHGAGGTYENIPVAKVILSSALENGQIKSLKEFDKIHSGYFKDKIVVIGQTSAGTDIHPTPMSSVYPGPEIIVTAIDNILNDADTTNPNRRKFIQKSPVVIDFLLGFILCFVIGYTMIKTKSNAFKMQIFASILLLFVIFAIFAFVHPQIRIWLNMTYPLIFMVLTGISSYAYVTYLENKERKQVEMMFGKFVSPQILEKLLTEKKEISQSGQRKIMTVLFSDIRGFTTLSEQHPADEVIAILNEYITEMVEVILGYNGTLDKYIGDAIMAFYNDPVEMEDHALRAVLTSIGMKNKLVELNENWNKQGKAPLNIGIGINTGDMIVGHMGSHRLVDYTVIGDNVNLASRIESLTKNYGVNILISESTYNEVKEQVDARYIDEVVVKGKKNAVKVYEVLGLKPEFEELYQSLKEIGR
ncbi:MAG TPA: adenylate/guanylate cyclase domain-containing protein [Candidatus Gastranaerophilales bacterium]|nr:adenylate/guanylate cyclase domain-containing protein [Candidatus Gastranaerophilales bacterium]